MKVEFILLYNRW